jgi:nucleotide-binding universal stress UspA family protein
MIPFRKILFPVDYSTRCETVVPYVKETARRFKADLTLVHAYAPDPLAYRQFSVGEPDLMTAARLNEERRLQQYALETFPGEHVEYFAELGEAGSVIANVIQRQGTDLVMLATHGRGPFRRLLLGSVAAKVLHDIGAAVWTGVGSDLQDHAPQIPYKSVLCALDDSDEAEGVMTAAAALACDYQARLRLVHVVEMPPATFEVDFAPYRKDLIDAADFRLRELKGRLDLNVPHEVIDAPVADGVRDEALRRKADLIIIGRGRVQGTFSRIWSNVYPIVRESPCPVLSI